MAQSWIPSHTSVARHPKTRKLSRKLGVPLPAAVGHLHCLWHWIADIAPDGDLSQCDAEDIAGGGMWEPSDYDPDGKFIVPSDDEAETFLKALIDVGFLDQHASTLTAHNWDRYYGKVTGSVRAGQLGNHKRWHEDRGVVDPECEFCRPESPPDSPPISPGDGPDIAGESQNRLDKTREEEKKETSEKSSDPPRDDIESLCSLLHDLIVANGTPEKRAKVTDRWRDSARLLLDNDARPLDEATALMRWAQGNEFWRSNILSMPKFREQYDKLRLQMESSSNGHRSEAQPQYRRASEVFGE